METEDNSQETTETKDNSQEAICCKRFDPKPWDEKEITWKDKLFVKDKVTSLFHIPLNFGKVVVKNMTKIKAADAEDENPIFLSDEKSKWGVDLYISVTKEVAGAENIKLSGTYLTKVFEGSYKNMKKWIAEMNEFVKSKEKELKKLYFYYTTCPKCAKKFGKNYTVLVAKID